MIGHSVYILHPSFPGGLLDEDQVTVMELDEDLLQGTIVGTITDPDLDGIASGARFGNSLYVINARYFSPLEPSTEYWVTKLNIHDIQ